MEHHKKDLVAIVAATDKENGIGKNNDLPWSIPEDWNYMLKFIRTTKDSSKQNALIMGRKTWLSIPGDLSPFKPCLNIIISSKLQKSNINFKNPSDADHVLVAPSITAALSIVNNQHADSVEKVIAIGGCGIYKEVFGQSDFKRLYLTRIFKSFDCDTFLKPNNFLSKLQRVEGTEELSNESLRYNCDYNVIKKDESSGIEFIFEIYNNVN